MAYQHALGFICPYCKECTIQRYFSEEGCPKKDPSNRLFPYLMDVREFDEDKLETKLREDTKEIIRQFACLMIDIKQSLEKNASLTDLKDCILSIIMAGDAKINQTVIEAECLSEVFTNLCLQNYISFFHYMIIEHLIERYGSTDDKMKLKVYLEALEKFCQRKMCEVPPSVILCDSQIATESRVLIIIKRDEVNELNEVKELRRDLAQVFKIPSTALRLCSIEGNCVEFHFLISAAVADRIFPVSPSQCSALSEIGVKVAEGADPKTKSVKDQQ